jgi:hypothetical protein
MKNILPILLVSLFFRLIYLGVVPVSLSHDETDNIIQAHSLLRTGKDIVGTWQPLDFLPNNGVMAELGPVINAPLLSFLPNNLFTSRLTTALLSSIFPLLLLYWLTLIGVEGGVAYLTAWLLAISPWHILFSRTALEQPTSLFFYLLSWIFLSRLVLSYKSKYLHLMNFINMLLFTITYSIGFYTYHGYKFSLPILTGILILWHFFVNPKKRVRLLLIIPSLLVVGLVLRTALYSTYYSSRGSEILFSHTLEYQDQVNQDRRLSLAPQFLRQVYSNKPLKLMQNLRDKYVGALNPDLVYLHGESNGIFSTWQTGYLYLFTMPFLLLGIGYLVFTHSQDHLLILALLVLSPIASTIHINNTLAFRSGIYFVLLNIVTAYGLVHTSKQLKSLSKNLQLLIYFVFAFMITSSLSYFCYTYFYVTPVTHANTYFYNDRVIANYIRLTPENQTLIIVPQPRYLYSAITLARSFITKTDIDSFNHHYSPTDLDFYDNGSVTVAHSCKEVQARHYDTVIVSKNILADQGDCAPINKLMDENDLKSASLVSPQDSGEEYRIIGDRLCSEVKLGSFVYPRSLSDYRLDRMGKSDFCVKWVVKQ